MEEKRFAPSKRKLDRLYREGSYPFSLFLYRFSSLFLSWLLLYFFSSFMLQKLKAFAYCSFTSKEVFEVSALPWLSISGVFLVLWAFPIGIYFLVGGRISQKNNTQKGSATAVIFSCFAFVAFYFWGKKMVLLNLFTLFWTLLVVGLLFGLCDYFAQRHLFFKSARMDEREKKEEQKNQ
jgi:flagellar biosynthesis protein FlhB